MRIMVTGGAGMVGRAVVARLAEHGYSVLVFDRQPGEATPGVDFAQGDLLDYPALREHMRGCEAVVHLGAIPAPGIVSNDILFNINVSGTFNVFQAAAEEGIRRVVLASSINALGYYFGLRTWRLHYLPVDEDHPTETTDAYSLSKYMVEELGRYFWRRDGISSVALRFPGVMPAVAREQGWINMFREGIQNTTAALLAMPASARLAWFEEKNRLFDDFRGKRTFEDLQRREQMWMPDSPIPVEVQNLIGGRYNLFAVIDERDAAQAVEKSITAQFEGSHPLFVNDSSQYSGIDSSVLVELMYPDLIMLKRPLVGHEALVSNDRARALIGFEPEHSFAQEEN